MPSIMANKQPSIDMPVDKIEKILDHVAGQWAKPGVRELYASIRRGIDRMRRNVGGQEINPVTQCSFCGKGAGEATRLVMGPMVSICDECISVAHDVITEEDQVETGAVFAELNGRIRELEDALKIMTEDRNEFAVKLHRQQNFEQHKESDLGQLFSVVSSSHLHGKDSSLSKLPSFDEAKREAEAAAKTWPSERHYVMMAVGSAKACDVEWTKSDVYFTDDENENPF